MSAIDRVRAFFDKTNVNVTSTQVAKAFLTVATAVGLVFGAAAPAEARDHGRINLRISPSGVQIGVHDRHFHGNFDLREPRSRHYRHYGPRYPSYNAPQYQPFNNGPMPRVYQNGYGYEQPHRYTRSGRVVIVVRP